VTPPLLELVGAQALRGDFRLGPLDLAVRAGERVALLGPNGAGKSTALAVAVGEVPLAAGEARLVGAEVGRLPGRDVARRAALLRQAPEIAFALPVLEVVLHGRWAHLGGLRFPGEADVAAAREALGAVGLAGFEDRDLATLSAGERQRALLAKALVQASPLLLLDEPTSSLDLGHRVEVHGLLAGLPASTGLLLVTHDLDLAAALCERALLLAGGRVVASGTVEEVFRPDLLARAYGHDVVVERHPETGCPRVLPRFAAVNRRKIVHEESE